MTANFRALVVEDVPPQAEICAGYLRASDYDVRIAETADKAIAIVAEWEPDVAVIDIGLPDMDGLALMRRLKAANPGLAVIIATAHGSLATAVEAMRDGADDFIIKPYPGPRLVVTIANAVERRRLKKTVDRYKRQFDRDSFYGLIGSSSEMQIIYRTVESVGPSRAPVFITGESGTGKELVASAIHAVSGRHEKKFVALNCGAIPRELIESEIFGHIKGAFTGATNDRIGAAKIADGGTLFLDEIGELPTDMQVKLLRFIQSGTFQPVGSSRTEKVDVRFVCATNRDPRKEIERGAFREDLFYRLYVVPIHMPPLRDRGDDILLIANYVLELTNEEEKKNFKGFSPEVEQVFRRYSWPGNVRQLQNVVHNTVILHEGEVIERHMLPEPVRSFMVEAGLTAPAGEPQDAAPSTVNGSPISAAALSQSRVVRPLWQVEKEAILEALEQTDNNIPEAARLLEVNASTIYRRLQAWRSSEP